MASNGANNAENISRQPKMGQAQAKFSTDGLDIPVRQLDAVPSSLPIIDADSLPDTEPFSYQAAHRNNASAALFRTANCHDGAAMNRPSTGAFTQYDTVYAGGSQTQNINEGGRSDVASGSSGFQMKQAPTVFEIDNEDVKPDTTNDLGNARGLPSGTQYDPVYEGTSRLLPQAPVQYNFADSTQYDSVCDEPMQCNFKKPFEGCSTSKFLATQYDTVCDGDTQTQSSRGSGNRDISSDDRDDVDMKAMISREIASISSMPSGTQYDSVADDGQVVHTYTTSFEDAMEYVRRKSGENIEDHSADAAKSSAPATAFTQYDSVCRDEKDDSLKEMDQFGRYVQSGLEPAFNQQQPCGSSNIPIIELADDKLPASARRRLATTLLPHEREQFDADRKNGVTTPPRGGYETMQPPPPEWSRLCYSAEEELMVARLACRIQNEEVMWRRPSLNPQQKADVDEAWRSIKKEVAGQTEWPIQRLVMLWRTVCVHLMKNPEDKHWQYHKYLAYLVKRLPSKQQIQLLGVTGGATPHPQQAQCPTSSDAVPKLTAALGNMPPRYPSSVMHMVNGRPMHMMMMQQPPNQGPAQAGTNPNQAAIQKSRSVTTSAPNQLNPPAMTYNQMMLRQGHPMMGPVGNQPFYMPPPGVHPQSMPGQPRLSGQMIGPSGPFHGFPMGGPPPQTVNYVMGPGGMMHPSSFAPGGAVFYRQMAAQAYGTANGPQPAAMSRSNSNSSSAWQQFESDFIPPQKRQRTSN